MKTGNSLPHGLKVKIEALAKGFTSLFVDKQNGSHFDATVDYLQWLFAVEAYRANKNMILHGIVLKIPESDLLEYVKAKLTLSNDVANYLKKQNYQADYTNDSTIRLHFLSCSDLALTSNHCFGDVWNRLESLGLKKCSLPKTLICASDIEESPCSPPAQLVFYADPLFDTYKLSMYPMGISMVKNELKLITMFEDQHIDLNTKWAAVY